MHRSSCLLLVVVLTGCSAPDADEPETGRPEGEHGIWFDWIDPEDGEARPQALTEVEVLVIDEGVGLIMAHDTSIEGFDFWLELEVRFAGGPQRHTYDAQLAAPGTFRFHYEEAPSWAGRHVCGVGAVAEGSWVTVSEWLPAVDRFTGAFLLDFEGGTDDSECRRSDGGDGAGAAVRLEDGVWR